MQFILDIMNNFSSQNLLLISSTVADLIFFSPSTLHFLVKNPDTELLR